MGIWQYNGRVGSATDSGIKCSTVPSLPLPPQARALHPLLTKTMKAKTDHVTKSEAHTLLQPPLAHLTFASVPPPMPPPNQALLPCQHLARTDRLQPTRQARRHRAQARRLAAASGVAPQAAIALQSRRSP